MEGVLGDNEVSSLKNLSKFSFVSINSLFLLVILSPTTLYLLRKSGSVKTASTLGVSLLVMIDLVLSFRYSSLAIL